MNLVLGLSMTSSSVRWVLVEGTTGEGATLDRGSLATDTDQVFDADALLSSLFDKAGARRVHAIGLTWTGAAEATASAVWQALTDRQVDNVIAVSDLEAAEALTCGIADIAGYDRVVVCVVEPGVAVVVAVTPDGVTADRVDAAALADVDVLSPDAVFVVGSGDVDAGVAELERSTQAPVISAEDADLALARGSALASASAVSLLDAQVVPARRQLSPTAMLASVLAAAVVTFVVSLSVALGMSLVPGNEAPRLARSNVSVPETTTQVPPASPAKAAPRAPKSATPRAPEKPAAAEPVAVAVPVPDAALIIEPPNAQLEFPPEFQGRPPAYVPPAPAYIPPAPAYVPPAPPSNYLPPAPAPAPAYVPPALPAAQAPAAVSQQQPRLRDRIIEKIPIINRFHEPDPYEQ
ncbi:hypothetical protein NGTWS0302_02760 [Mycolicibacterium cyprinidarum]|uniref:FHA domain-containing protein n=1 Tax=Mycolicibacterium cyprinidarum TaxID=2860311 RepID=A0ABQ4V984_9MYCO|nr:hypothetical protein NGTWS1803_22300 [Mycolicibacterium sp. NGTWS1803]GJF12820.1 hypothetical protein NGTWS0302_02760 [Mycolicibacterium sp. NGTWS0302]GJF14084.1 hypothetical protein NGTWS1702_15400 [Mycolicibacterium sp. NGTWSNA01]